MGCAGKSLSTPPSLRDRTPFASVAKPLAHFFFSHPHPSCERRHVVHRRKRAHQKHSNQSLSRHRVKGGPRIRLFPRLALFPTACFLGLGRESPCCIMRRLLLVGQKTRHPQPLRHNVLRMRRAVVHVEAVVLGVVEDFSVVGHAVCCVQSVPRAVPFIKCFACKSKTGMPVSTGC